MRKSIIYIVLTLLMIICGTTIRAMAIDADTSATDLIIPVEIISRIPDSEVATFILARQRVIDHKEIIPDDAYIEIGVSKEILSRVPSSDLFEFLNERGYVELAPQDHISHGQHHGPPSPQEMLKLLYLFICIIAGLVLINMVLTHLNRKKDQEIIIKALENNKDIPIDMLHSSRQRRYLNLGILLSAIGVGIIFLGMTGFLPGVIAVIPLSVAAGYFIIRYVNDRSA